MMGDYTKQICPAELSEEITNKMKNIALQVHELLRLGSYSRIDFIIASSFFSFH